jgi:hypothetical protein
MVGRKPFGKIKTPMKIPDSHRGYFTRENN